VLLGGLGLLFLDLDRVLALGTELADLLADAPSRTRVTVNDDPEDQLPISNRSSPLPIASVLTVDPGTSHTPSTTV
jgi:hypothetical protein